MSHPHSHQTVAVGDCDGCAKFKMSHCICTSWCLIVSKTPNGLEGVDFETGCLCIGVIYGIYY